MSDNDGYRGKEFYNCDVFVVERSYTANGKLIERGHGMNVVVQDNALSGQLVPYVGVGACDSCLDAIRNA